MPQDDQLGLTRRSRRVYRSGGDRDDRGWTLLHIGARKGDLKEVCFLAFLDCLAFLLITVMGFS